MDASTRLISVQRLLTAIFGKDQGKLVQPGAGAADVITVVDEVLSLITQRERTVIEQRFGLNGEAPKLLREVGAALGVSRERIRQIEAKTLRKLRHPSRGSRRLRPYLHREETD